MKFRSPFILSMLLIGTGTIYGCSDNQTTARESDSQSKQAINYGHVKKPEKITEFFTLSYEDDLKSSPLTQSYRGIKWDYDKWDDLSPEAEEARIELLKQRLETLNSFDQSEFTAQQKLSFILYKQDIERRLANDEFRAHSYVMQQLSGWHTRIPSFMINIHKISTLSDAQDYISRLNKVDVLFEQLIAQLQLREDAGVFPPKWSYDQMIQASANVISGNPFEEKPNDSTLLADFKEKLDSLGLSNAEKSGLINQLNDALLNSVKPAYENMIATLTKQRALSPEGDGVWRLPQGDKWYQNRLAWYTTTDLDAQQVHDLGLLHVERIHNQMQAIMQQVGFTGTLQEFFVFMRNDPQFYYENTPEGKQEYLNQAKALIDDMKTRLPEYFGLIPQADIRVKAVEAFREQTAGKAFYQSPAVDSSRPGTYYANLYKMDAMPTYQMAALAYHEGIPGHHMQRSITQELDGIPEFQKYLSFTAFTEGWGLYSEELAKDMGLYQDPYADFGRLAMELWRACRLVVDTGIHDKQWSKKQAIDYLVENTPNAESDAIKAIERYIALPGQATAYMIGKLKIMALREKAQKTLGDRFSYADFHDQVLKNGPIPLNVLEQQIDAWIADVASR
ncbi:DUF885 domain-containing protein [Glaciecola sp. 1036]|uniref:DUF885 domain-containing protein n=1 Tax=Alteromonadaceae TaxID=72275 RepID=UPI003D0852BC